MGKFDAYKIQLKSLPEGIQEYQFHIDDKFFSEIDGPEVHKGRVDVLLQVNRKGDTFEMKFTLGGVAVVPCDRCLDDMEVPVETENTLSVKFGSGYSEEGDVLVVPENEGEVNIAWFLYEFVALEIPMKHVHPAGKCNKKMSSVLRKHSGRTAGEGDDDAFVAEDDEFYEAASETDPRWDELKKMIDEN